MNLEHERKALAIFAEICELPEPERAERLVRLMAADPELGATMARLLANDAAAHSFLEEPALAVESPSGLGLQGAGSVRVAHRPPDAIGPYHILEELGAGGMGIVYRALDERLRRDVALKVMREGFPAPGVERQFESEAAALARLHHPGIATIFEAGSADFGRGLVPYLAMELVPGGTNLVQHARSRGLDLRARVALLVQVSHAVHHAHKNGVIHRDLKPENILVDPDGAPRVVDFGLAHLLDAEHGISHGSDGRRILGTLAYMSPEQLAAEPTDTTTDVYSLGATAYHLLAERPPHDLDGMNLAAGLLKVSRERPRPLVEIVPGADRDISAILEKAMASAREQRYASASALADDFSRWLAGEMVLARRASTVEQLVKFARRNRLLVGAASAFVLVLAVGVVVSTWYARQLHRQWVRAETIKAVLQNTLRSAGDPRTDGRELPLTHALRRASAELARFSADPVVQAEIADTLGMAYFENGVYTEAEELLRSTLETREALLGPEHLDTLAAINNLGVVLVAVGRLGEAEEHLRRSLAGRRQILGQDDEATQRSANWLAQILLYDARPVEAEALLAASLAVRKRTLGPDHAVTLSTRKSLARAWRHLGRIAEAERELVAVLEMERTLFGTGTFGPYETMNSLASLLLEAGRGEEASLLLAEALEGYRRLRGEDHPDTLLIRNNLAAAEASAAVAADEAPDAETIGDTEAPAESDASPRLSAVLLPLAVEKFYAGEIEAAEADLRKVVATFEAAEGNDLVVIAAKQNLASLLAESGRLAQALELRKEVYGTYLERGMGNSLLGLLARGALADSLRIAGELEPALAEAWSAYTELRALAVESVYTLNVRAIVASVLTDLGRLEEALEHSAVAVRVAERALGESYPQTLLFRVRHGVVLTRLGRFEEAERELVAAHAGLLAKHGQKGPYTQRAARACAELYESWQRPQELACWKSDPAWSVSGRVGAGQR